MDLASKLITALTDIGPQSRSPTPIKKSHDYILRVQYSGMTTSYTLIDSNGSEVWRWPPLQEQRLSRAAANDNQGNFVDLDA